MNLKRILITMALMGISGLVGYKICEEQDFRLIKKHSKELIESIKEEFGQRLKEEI
jgi:hypothetical protein